MAWLKHLKKSGMHNFFKASRMFQLHRTPFNILLNNIFEAMDLHQAKFTFPIVASVAQRNPDLIHQILKEDHEVASHGFKHLKYFHLTQHQQEEDFRKAQETFKKLKITIQGFRAPYNNYTKHTLHLLEKHNYLWDGGIGHTLRNGPCTVPFRVSINSHKSSFTCLPLNEWTDDLMIDQCRFNLKLIGKVLKLAMKRVQVQQGVLMFDLHPIRISQPQYLEVLKKVVEYGYELDGWFPTVTEAVKYWRKHGRWKHTFCCLMTGDIDNYVFSDYLRRLL